MLSSSAKVIRLTASEDLGGHRLVSGIQSVGDTADLYEDTSAVATNLKVVVAANAFHTFEHPVRFTNLFVDLGAAGPIYVHVV